jgi:oligosaccharide repeat unit polymerase
VSTIIILLCITVILFSWTREKNIYNPLMLFFGLWAIVVFGDSLHLFGLYKADNIIYFIFFIGLLSYLFGYYIIMLKQNTNHINVKNERSNDHKDNEKFIINEKSFFVLGFLTLFIIWKTALPTVLLLLSGVSFYDVRYVLLGTTMETQNNFLLSYFALPFSHVMLHLSLINFFLYKKKNFLLLTILVLLGVVLTNGARLYLLYYLIDAVVIKVIFNDIFGKKMEGISRKLNRRRNIYISVLTAVLLLGMAYITLLRKSDIFKTIYKYVVGTVPHMSQRYEEFEIVNKYTYGVTSYQGFFRPIFSLLDKIGVNSELFSLSEYFSNQWQSAAFIAPDTIYNFCVSLFMYFYVDLGIVGVIIGSITYGIICALAYRSMKKNTNVKSLALYLMIVQSILMSMIRYQFTDLSFALAFFYLFFVIKKRNNRMKSI